MKIISRRTQKRLKEAFYTITNHFMNYFQDQVYKNEGYRVKEIKFHSLDPIAIIGRNRKLHLFEVSFSSEMGFHKSKLAIKVFDSIDKVLQEASGNQSLRYILDGNKEVKTVQLLYYSSEYKLLIYEGLYAEEFNKVKFSDEERYYLAGRSLAFIHNKELKKVDLQRYYTFIENIFIALLNSNLIPKATLDSFKDKLVAEIENRMFYSYGGSSSFGDFHPGNIMFELREEKYRNYGLKSDKYRIILIDPEFIEDCTEQTCTDRFEDIGTFFAKSILEDFINSNGKPKNSENFVKNFLKGYNTVYEKFRIKLSDMYPQGTTFELQMIIAILFDLMYYIKTSDNDEWLKNAIRVRLAFINYLFGHPYNNIS